MVASFTMEKKIMQTICTVHFKHGSIHISITNIVTNIATYKVYAYKVPDYAINKQLSYIHIDFLKENSAYLTIH